MVEDGTGYHPANPHVQPERGAALETDISTESHNNFLLYY